MNKIDLKTILNPYFLLIFSAVLFSTLSDQFLQKKIELLISSKEGLTGMIWMWGGLSIINAIVFPLLISILCAFLLVARSEKIKKFISDNLELSLIETLRAWGKTFLWSFIFILPGFVRFIHYIFTPFVVLFSQKYKNGEVDALEYSTIIAKSFFWPLNLWLAVFFLIVPVLGYVLFDEYSLFASHPVTATAIVLIQALVQLSFNFVFLRLFIKYLNEVENVAHV